MLKIFEILTLIIKTNMNLQKTSEIGKNHKLKVYFLHLNAKNLQYGVGTTAGRVENSISWAYGSLFGHQHCQ